ncbi:hypothetical protein [Legionella shakespearei]|uniref:Uncharacterized protein n=1 Tax=Legionella shakespearei DSM 23087 TaxID=1122169 RepID=A0A0W0YIT8_9GAMM|nr:hypothetical protein [Legionella shakespearei]KTD56446.1 hypothetical protein Lsha_2845 [Legionella shakespearei DSM 23087]
MPVFTNFKDLYQSLKSSWAAEAPEVTEMRLQDSVENNNDPNDMPLEVEKNLKSNLGPIDTEAEIKREEENNRFRP